MSLGRESELTFPSSTSLARNARCHFWRRLCVGRKHLFAYKEVAAPCGQPVCLLNIGTSSGLRDFWANVYHPSSANSFIIPFALLDHVKKWEYGCITKLIRVWIRVWGRLWPRSARSCQSENWENYDGVLKGDFRFSLLYKPKCYPSDLCKVSLAHE